MSTDRPTFYVLIGSGGLEESREGARITQLMVCSWGPAEVAAADTWSGGAVLQHQEAKCREAAAGGQGGGEACFPVGLLLPSFLLPALFPPSCPLLFMLLPLFFSTLPVPPFEWRDTLAVGSVSFSSVQTFNFWRRYWVLGTPSCLLGMINKVGVGRGQAFFSFPSCQRNRSSSGLGALALDPLLLNQSTCFLLLPYFTFLFSLFSSFSLWSLSCVNGMGTQLQEGLMFFNHESNSL